MHLPTVLLGNDALLVRVVIIKSTSRTRGRDWKGRIRDGGIGKGRKGKGEFYERISANFPFIYHEGSSSEAAMVGAS